MRTQEAGVFSKLEASGGFSKIEGLLPLGAHTAHPHLFPTPLVLLTNGSLPRWCAADDLKLLSTAEALMLVSGHPQGGREV